MKSESIAKLAEALAKAQLQMESAKKDSVNPFFKNTYADLAAVIDAIKEPLGKNGLSYVQYVEDEADKIYITTLLMHSSGEWISGRLKLVLQKQDMQGLGGAITYGRRYALSAMVGITQDDDDGNTASGRSQSRDQVHSQPKPAPEIKKVVPPPVEAKDLVESPNLKPEFLTESDLNQLKSLMSEFHFSKQQIMSYCHNQFKKPFLSINQIEFDTLCDAIRGLKK